MIQQYAQGLGKTICIQAICNLIIQILKIHDHKITIQYFLISFSRKSTFCCSWPLRSSNLLITPEYWKLVALGQTSAFSVLWSLNNFCISFSWTFLFMPESTVVRQLKTQLCALIFELQYFQFKYYTNYQKMKNNKTS